MKINFKATGMGPTDAILSYLEKKLSPLEKLYQRSGDVLRVDAEVGKTTKHHQKGPVFRAELKLSCGKDVFRAESEEEDLYAAIDEAKDELFSSIKSSRDKSIARERQGSRKIKKLIKNEGFR